MFVIVIISTKGTLNIAQPRDFLPFLPIHFKTSVRHLSQAALFDNISAQQVYIESIWAVFANIWQRIGRIFDGKLVQNFNPFASYIFQYYPPPALSSSSFETHKHTYVLKASKLAETVFVVPKITEIVHIMHCFCKGRRP